MSDDFWADLFKEIHKDALSHRQGRKDEFITRARALFEPSPRAPCYICGKHGRITHAHHVIPLSDQFNRGFNDPDHEHVWLCPNHHAIVHLFLSESTANLGKEEILAILSGISPQQIGTLHALLMRARRGPPK